MMFSVLEEDKSSSLPLLHCLLDLNRQESKMFGERVAQAGHCVREQEKEFPGLEKVIN